MTTTAKKQALALGRGGIIIAAALGLASLLWLGVVALLLDGTAGAAKQKTRPQPVEVQLTPPPDPRPRPKKPARRAPAPAVKPTEGKPGAGKARPNPPIPVPQTLGSLKRPRRGLERDRRGLAPSSGGDRDLQVWLDEKMDLVQLDNVCFVVTGPSTPSRKKPAPWIRALVQATASGSRIIADPRVPQACARDRVERVLPHGNTFHRRLRFPLRRFGSSDQLEVWIGGLAPTVRSVRRRHGRRSVDCWVSGGGRARCRPR